MSVTASPAALTARSAAATNERSGGNLRSSEVWLKNTRSGPSTTLTVAHHLATAHESRSARDTGAGRAGSSAGSGLRQQPAQDLLGGVGRLGLGREQVHPVPVVVEVGQVREPGIGRAQQRERALGGAPALAEGLDLEAFQLLLLPCSSVPGSGQGDAGVADAEPPTEHAIDSRA